MGPTSKGRKEKGKERKDVGKGREREGEGEKGKEGKAREKIKTPPLSIPA